MKNHFVHTPCGPVQGAAGGADGVSVFRGIRYATAGRWEYPRQVTHWDGVYDAANFGACSFQPRAFYSEEDVPEKAFYYNEFRRGEHYDYSEDCLFLNIWAPDDAKNAPVLFYIHGGGFLGGCRSLPPGTGIRATTQCLTRWPRCAGCGTISPLLAATRAKLLLWASPRAR